jgi:hypothetical protein
MGGLLPPSTARGLSRRPPPPATIPPMLMLPPQHGRGAAQHEAEAASVMGSRPVAAVLRPAGLAAGGAAPARIITNTALPRQPGLQSNFL